MVSLFRINDPFRVIIVFIILLAIRLPLLLVYEPFTQPEMLWLTLGEKMAEGQLLYQDIWTSIAPLSALIYWLFFLLFDKTVIPFWIASALLTIYQATTFNMFLNRNSVFGENTYIPALLYMVFCSFTFEFYTLHPLFLSLTFLLRSLRNVFRTERRVLDQEIFKTGIYLGISTLFYLLAFVFVFPIIIGYALFRTSSAKHLFIVLFGFSFTLVILFTYLFFSGTTLAFFDKAILGGFGLTTKEYLNYGQLLILLAIPGLVLLYTTFRTLAKGSFINYQVNCIQIMLLWLIASVAFFFLSDNLSTSISIVFVPVLTFFTTHFLLIIRKRWMAEVAFWSIAIPIVGLSFVVYTEQIPFIPTKASYNKFFIKEKPYGIENKKVLAISDDLSVYGYNSLATPFLDWDLAKRHFQSLESPNQQIEFYEWVKNDLPDIIVDEDNEYTEKLFYQLPILKEKYRQYGGNLYYLK